MNFRGLSVVMFLTFGLATPVAIFTYSAPVLAKGEGYETFEGKTKNGTFEIKQVGVNKFVWTASNDEGGTQTTMKAAKKAARASLKAKALHMIAALGGRACSQFCTHKNRIKRKPTGSCSGCPRSAAPMPRGRAQSRAGMSETTCPEPQHVDEVAGQRSGSGCSSTFPNPSQTHSR